VKLIVLLGISQIFLSAQAKTNIEIEICLPGAKDQAFTNGQRA
jgi:hypothetical protein